MTNSSVSSSSGASQTSVSASTVLVTSPKDPSSIVDLSDKVLLERCEYFGKQVLLWRNKFIGLLPEVSRRKLYEQKGCGSIHEFGKKFAGLSEEQVSLALNVEKRFDQLPVLKELLVSGKVSINKMSRIAGIATEENQQVLADQVQLLSVGAIKTMVRDMRCEENSLDVRSVATDSLDVHKPERNSLFSQDPVQAAQPHLDEDVRARLMELEEKGIDINQLLRETLDRREKDIQEKKQEVADSLPEQSTRNIPRKVKNIIKEEYGLTCSATHCTKPSVDIHHLRRFRNIPSHDPNFMAPLCKQHHQIAHTMDVRYQECRKK